MARLHLGQPRWSVARPTSLRAQDGATSPWSTTVTTVRCPTDVTAGAGPQDRATSPWSTTVTAVRCPTDVTAGAGPQDGATSPWSTTVTAVRCPTNVTAGAGWRDVTLVNHGDHSPLPDRRHCGRRTSGSRDFTLVNHGDRSPLPDRRHCGRRTSLHGGRPFGCPDVQVDDFVDGSPEMTERFRNGLNWDDVAGIRPERIDGHFASRARLVTQT